MISTTTLYAISDFINPRLNIAANNLKTDYKEVRGLCVDLSDTTIIPRVIAEYNVLNKDVEASSIILPLRINRGNTPLHRTFNSALRTFNRSQGLGTLNAIRVKDLVFYGGNGLLFDEEWDLLFASCYNCKLSIRPVSGHQKFNPLSDTYVVHPKCFHLSNLIESNIIKTIIPTIMESTLPTGCHEDTEPVVKVMPYPYTLVTPDIEAVGNIDFNKLIRADSKSLTDNMTMKYSYINF